MVLMKLTSLELLFIKDILKVVKNIEKLEEENEARYADRVSIQASKHD